MAPTVSFDESEEAAVVQTATRLFLPCTPRQALTYQAMFSMHHEEGDSVTLHQVETKSVGHHVLRLEFDLPKFMARDGLIDQVFMPVGSNGEAFLAMLRGTTHPACPKKAGVTRVVLPIQGFFFQAGTNSDGVSGTMVTCTSCMDPLGWVPKVRPPPPLPPFTLSHFRSLSCSGTSTRGRRDRRWIASNNTTITS